MKVIFFYIFVKTAVSLLTIKLLDLFITYKISQLSSSMFFENKKKYFVISLKIYET